MTIKPRRIKKGYSYIFAGKIQLGDWVSLRQEPWEQAYGLVNHAVEGANKDGWKVCRKNT